MQPDVAILRRWLSDDGGALSPDDLDRLAAGLDRDRLLAWDIPTDSVRARLQARAERLRSVLAPLRVASERLGLVPGDRWLQLAWDLWLPLALKISRRHHALQRPLIWGILGLQGTGKTTLARLLQAILTARGYSVLCLSIDDLYRTYRDRQMLQKQDPRLIWRGPPGTHDVDLGIELLAAIRAGRTPLRVPRFDKTLRGGAGDRIAPQTLTKPVDIVLFEGWCLGVRPIAERAFATAPWPIVTVTDRKFARACNARLGAYLPLWAYLDAVIALYPDDYRQSLRWRQEAEARARLAGKGSMSDREVADFVAYFWRALHPELFVKPLLADAAQIDLAIALDAHRQPTRIYRPARGSERAV